MLAVEILLADPEALGDDVLESCLYLLRERLRTAWARVPVPAACHQPVWRAGRSSRVADHVIRM